MKFSTVFLALIVTIMVADSANAQFIVAHRGASFVAPENTISAFKRAWELNADAIEGDFYVTKDNQIACIHDKTTKRTAPGSPELKVADSTLKQLQQLDVGSWKDPQYAGERIPTLQDVLGTVPEGKQIFVEIKCGVEILPLMQPILEHSGLKDDQIAIICFDKQVVTEARKLMPQYRVNWLTSYKNGKPTIASIVETLQRTKASGLGSKGDLSVIDEAFVEKINQSGGQLHVWTVNDPAQARRFAELGVVSITTDKPDVIRESIRILN
ncbi:glycerophosphodiester phosphodiesterase [Roseiconus lacunae]|uniref:Glycerophosphodiester phosphodiesterase n=1 Tax=Roseiconus lacunae TaxID=2605694 RepID=A0ABT7PR87_9BACT|nr:glycerophosphodiester phosphodiesterase [Roseiconus lacunae]MDM4019030.1 glycerophosphodiester phosphodiesterase [Roseiconus lacunae]WRQ48664.1 glycerophosphodiester phosphodiesterase [Stieleria sp. HD01]